MTTKASTYGFTVNPDQHWSHSAACAQSDMGPDLWFSGHTAQPKWSELGRAIHICKEHCPVKRECRRDMGVMPDAVVAGVFYNEKGRVSDYQPVLPYCGRCARG
jgi:hypothetical protein